MKVRINKFGHLLGIEDADDEIEFGYGHEVERVGDKEISYEVNKVVKVGGKEISYNEREIPSKIHRISGEDSEVEINIDF